MAPDCGRRPDDELARTAERGQLLVGVLAGEALVVVVVAAEHDVDARRR